MSLISVLGFLVTLVFALYNVQKTEAKVLELSDRFLPLKHEGMWLVMVRILFVEKQNQNCFLFQFYAPWCGHCKKLEPIWKHVDQSIAGKLPVRVGRLDSTRFTTVANEFNIRGFPTILL